MRKTSSLYAHQAINLSTGGQYSLNHFGTSTVCFLWSFHFSLASKPLKRVWTGHPALQRIVSQNNKVSIKLEASKSRWRHPHHHIKAPWHVCSSYLEITHDFCRTFDWRGGQRKFTVQYFGQLSTIIPSFSFFSSPLQEEEVLRLSNCHSIDFTDHRGAETCGRTARSRATVSGKALPYLTCASVHLQRLSGSNHWRPISDRAIKLGEKKPLG